MKQLNLEKCESLADVFSAVIGGRPESFKEIKEFMEKSPLNQLIYATDIDRIINYDGFFSEEVIDAIYTLLPVKLQIAPTRSWIMTPQSFRKLNAAQITKPASRFINVPLTRVFTIYKLQYEDKIKGVINAIQGIEETSKAQSNISSKSIKPEEKIKADKRAQKSLYDKRYRQKKLKKEKKVPDLPQKESSAPSVHIKPTEPEIAKEKTKSPKTSEKHKEKQSNKETSAKGDFMMPKKDKRYPKWIKIVTRLQEIKKRRALKTTPKEEQEKLKKEANCLQTAKYRLEHPDAWKKSYKKMSDLSPEKQAERRAGNNRRNDIYRQNHREELRAYHNNLRVQEKADNPEAVKEKDKKHNSSTVARAAKKRYYEKNAQQVIERAIRHNKIKRFKQKTGPVILGLLQGIINSKIK